MKLKIIHYHPSMAQHFKIINEEWIQKMFKLEDKDRKILDHPQDTIINQGGVILFVEAGDLGIVGAGALLKTGPEEYELTKMGVLEKARGMKAGEFLLKALIASARGLSAKNLYLLTNSKCEAAVHLYEKHGFKHDAEIMRKFVGEYQRCNIAMKYAVD